LKPYEEKAQAKALDLLEEALAKGVQPNNPNVTAQLQATGPGDVADLLPHLEKRGAELAEQAEKMLAARGLDEAGKMREILLSQKKRIGDTAALKRELLLTDFLEGERQQLEADKTHWGKRLLGIDKELETEPERIRDVYDVKARRVEPVGLAYLWPSSG